MFFFCSKRLENVLTRSGPLLRAICRKYRAQIFFLNMIHYETRSRQTPLFSLSTWLMVESAWVRARHTVELIYVKVGCPGPLHLMLVEVLCSSYRDTGWPTKGIIGKIGKNKKNTKHQDFSYFCLIWEMGGPNQPRKAGFLLTSILPYRILNSENFFVVEYFFLNLRYWT